MVNAEDTTMDVDEGLHNGHSVPEEDGTKRRHAIPPPGTIALLCLLIHPLPCRSSESNLQ